MDLLACCLMGRVVATHPSLIEALVRSFLHVPELPSICVDVYEVSNSPYIYRSDAKVRSALSVEAIVTDLIDRGSSGCIALASDLLDQYQARRLS